MNEERVVNIMPVALIFLLVFLMTLLPGDVSILYRNTLQPVNQEVLKWDQHQFHTLAELHERRKEFEEQIQYYRSTIEDKLTVEEMSHLIKEANRHDIPVEILIKLLKTESNFNKDTVGPLTAYGHAYGIAQFMENTAPWIAEMADLDYDKEYLFDPLYSITLAATYLNYLQYGDEHTHAGFHDWHATLTAYNRGIGGFKTYVRDHQTTVSRFSNTIIKQAREIALDHSNEKQLEVSIH